jgi:hypothetical protein
MGAAATAVVAAAARHVFFGRCAAQLEGLGDVLANGSLHFLHGLLRIEKTARDGVIYEDVAMLVEIIDLAIFQRGAHLLLLLQHFALFHDGLILRLRVFVAHELVDLLAHGLKFRLGNNRFTELAGLLNDGGFFSGSSHNQLL